MKMSGKLYSLVFVMLLMAVTFWASIHMETVKLKLLPLIISVSLFVLAGAEFVREIRSNAEAPKVKSVQKKWTDAKAELSGYLSISLWIGGFFLATYFLGFLVSIPCFIFAYMKCQGTGWKLAASIAFIMVGFIYVVFELFLRVGLHEGILTAKVMALL